MENLEETLFCTGRIVIYIIYNDIFIPGFSRNIEANASENLEMFPRCWWWLYTHVTV